MKIGFHEGCDYHCADHEVMRDLELCEKYGFDYITIEEECLERDLKLGKCTVEGIGEWVRGHNLKVLAYSTVASFNMRQTEEEKAAVQAHMDEAIRRSRIFGCDLINIVSSSDMQERGLQPTKKEIRDDAVAVIRELIKKTEPYGIRLTLEACGFREMTINRYDEAFKIVEEVDSPYLGITLDQHHFYAMASSWAALEQFDGRKIFVLHIDGVEDLPPGAWYNYDYKRTWPHEDGDCLDHARYANTLRRNGFSQDVCNIEVFRPAYYELSQEENVRKAAEVTRAHVARYYSWL